MSEKRLEVKVITPQRVLFEGEVQSLLVKTRGEVGEFAILPDHIPMTSDVGLGSLVLRTDEGAKTATLMGGYLVVLQNRVVVMAQAAEWPEEIDKERAEQARLRAEAYLKQEEFDHARAQAALTRAMIRLNLSDRIK